jgi:nucleotide-binding universal stress UspA family protein
LPTLAKASSVLVVTAESADRASAERLLSELERPGAKASRRTEEIVGVDVGDFLLNVVADERVDLLVMGAYGHSRMRPRLSEASAPRGSLLWINRPVGVCDPHQCGRNDDAVV